MLLNVKGAGAPQFFRGIANAVGIGLIEPIAPYRDGDRTAGPHVRRDGVERLVFASWLASAAVVTIARLLYAAAPGYDLGQQIQAAHNLLAGNGLSWYRHIAPDLTMPASLITLTHFPAGYSLYFAAVTKAGLGVGSAVKLLGAFATMLGWWGWARLAEPFFARGLRRSRFWRGVAVAIAISLPLLFTAPWGGTDIVLWATVPWVVLLLADAASARPGWREVLAGGLCGLSVLVRYASLFLALYAAAIIVWQTRLHWTVLRRWLAFGLGFAPAVAVQAYVNYVVANTAATPGSLSVRNADPALVLHRAWDGLQMLGNATYPWVFWLTWRGMDRAFAATGWLHAALWLVSLAAVVIVARSYVTSFSQASRDPRTISLGIFVAIPLMLWGCMLLSWYDFLADSRHYSAVVPLGLFVIYSVAVNAASFRLPIRAAASAYLIAFVVLSAACIAYFASPSDRGSAQRAKLLPGDFAGNDPRAWPSTAVVYELSEARNFVKQLLAQRPGSLLVMSKGAWFYWDPALDQSRIHEVDCNYWKASFINGPAHIVILSADIGRPEQAWYYGGGSSFVHADCVARLPGVRLVRRFPGEGVKVMEAQIDAGTRVVLDRRNTGSMRTVVQ
jgi:hypothetical protein